MVPFPGAPQRRSIVGLLQPEVIPFIPQDDQARIIRVPGRDQTGLHARFHGTLLLHSLTSTRTPAGICPSIKTSWFFLIAARTSAARFASFLGPFVIAPKT